MAPQPFSHATRVLPLQGHGIKIKHRPGVYDQKLDEIQVDIPKVSPEAIYLHAAASVLRDTSVPLAFPTETVYGLGADATRSSAVHGIYAAKNRPMDNPLIVHVCSLSQLRKLLPRPSQGEQDPIPQIYHPLISRFWPGPLTILLPLPRSMGEAEVSLAPEVTAGQPAFGARMPSNPLALALIHAADRPLAAPSANASTRPSPTRAEHVLHDLGGRIELILDGGACDVGVESTVVDGTSDPPAVLRPGGVSIEQIRECEGWEGCVVAYKDEAEGGDETEVESGGKGPRAPGMKYKHYSPTAKVALVKAGLLGHKQLQTLVEKAAEEGFDRIGVLRGKSWDPLGPEGSSEPMSLETTGMNGNQAEADHELQFMQYIHQHHLGTAGRQYYLTEGQLGKTSTEMARNLFWALREMDRQNVQIVFIEGLSNSEGEGASAVMNRLRKAAEIKISSLPWEP